MEALLHLLAAMQIPLMFIVLFATLVVRFVTYRRSKRDSIYFSTLTREMRSLIEKDKEANIKTEGATQYLASFLGRLSQKMPTRTLRIQSRETGVPDNVYSLDQYLNGQNGFLTGIQTESNVFHCKTPPNFTEFTYRLMSQDENWNKLWKFITVDSISRLLDILPGLFIVSGVIGTFVGIALALPEITKIDFNNVATSSKFLSNFILHTAFAMKTSILGIVFSIVLTLMNTMFPIKEVRYRILKQVESTLETFWYHVHHSTNEDTELKQLLPKILAILEGYSLAQKKDVDWANCPPIPQPLMKKSS